MNNYNYAYSKFTMAVQVLATDPHEIKHRLMEAFNELVVLFERDMPDPLKEDLKWIKSTLTKNPPKMVRLVREGRLVEESTGRIGATVPYMRIKTAVSVAERICYVEARLRNEFMSA